MADLNTGSSFVAGDTIVASAMNTRFTTIETWANGTPNIGGSSGATTIDNNLAVTGTVTVTGTSTFNNTLTVGQNDTGHDVKFYGATAGAYMEWDESEDDLILGGAATFVLPDGSASAPVITNSGDTNTGIYFSAADEVSITTGGTKRFTIESTGLIKSPHSYVAETGNAANLWVDTDGGFYRYTSSARIKTNIETLDDNVADNVLNLRPVSYNSTAEPDDPTQIFWGFIAEEVDKVDPTLVQYGDNGRIDGVNYVQIIPALLNIIKRQEARIAALEA